MGMLKVLGFLVAVFVVSVAFHILEGGFGPSSVQNARAWAQAVVVVEAIWMSVLGIRAGLSMRSDRIAIEEGIGNALAVIVSGAIIAAMLYREVGGHFPTRFDGIVPVPLAWLAGTVGILGNGLALLVLASSVIFRSALSRGSSRLPVRPEIGAIKDLGVWRQLAVVRWNYASGILVVTAVGTSYLLATCFSQFDLSLA